MTIHHRSRSVSSTSPATGTELLARFRAEMNGVPEDDVLTPRVDVAAAASTAIGAMPELELKRAALEARFGKRATSALDGLVPIARALLASNAAYVAAVDKDLEPEAQSMREVRDRLANAATALIERGLVSPRSLAKLTGGSSYQALFTDTLALVAWFETHAEAIKARSKVTRVDLRSAYAAAEHFGRELAQRDGARAGTSAPADARARAFALFVEAYETVRKMVTYVRWHQGDADLIAPSIYVRGPRSQRDTNGTPPAAPPVTTQPVPPGMPGGSPFHP